MSEQPFIFDLPTELWTSLVPYFDNHKDIENFCLASKATHSFWSTTPYVRARWWLTKYPRDAVTAFTKWHSKEKGKYDYPFIFILGHLLCHTSRSRKPLRFVNLYNLSVPEICLLAKICVREGHVSRDDLLFTVADEYPRILKEYVTFCVLFDTFLLPTDSFVCKMLLICSEAYRDVFANDVLGRHFRTLIPLDEIEYICDRFSPLVNIEGIRSLYRSQ